MERAPPAPPPLTPKPRGGVRRAKVGRPQSPAETAQPSRTRKPQDTARVKYWLIKLELFSSIREYVHAHTHAHSHSCLDHKYISVHKVIGDLCFSLYTCLYFLK